MAVEITVQGQEFRRFQAKLKTLDKDIQRGIRKEMNATIRTAGRKVLDDVREAARSDLPSTGGFAERVASRPMKVSITSKAVTFKVIGMDAKSAERGRLRHPVYGNRQNWATQNIRPGWFSRQMDQENARLRAAIMEAVERALTQVEGV